MNPKLNLNFSKRIKHRIVVEIGAMHKTLSHDSGTLFIPKDVRYDEC
jgi:hypothetical protein